MSKRGIKMMWWVTRFCDNACGDDDGNYGDGRRILSSPSSSPSSRSHSGGDNGYGDDGRSGRNRALLRAGAEAIKVRLERRE